MKIVWFCSPRWLLIDLYTFLKITWFIWFKDTEILFLRVMQTSFYCKDRLTLDIVPTQNM